jgi:hypothetical protein
MHSCLARHWCYNHPMNFIGKLPRTARTVLLTFAAGWAIAFASAVKAEPSVSVMSVRALVSPTVVMKFEGSSVQLSITEDDIARGYIDVPGTYRLTITTDRTMQQLANIMVDYEPNPYNFTSIQVAARTLQTGEPNPYDFMSIQVATRALQTGEPRTDTTLANFINALPATAAGPFDGATKNTEAGNSFGTVPRAPAPGGRASVTSLGYRLMLPENSKPGNISLPLTLSLQL